MVRSPLLDIQRLFGGSYLGCKYLLMEPLYSYFSVRSSAMHQKMSFARTHN